MADIKTHLNNIKGALYGKDVRGSIHDGIDAINKEVENTTGRQVDLESTFDQLVINAGNSNAEIVDARVKNDGTSYSKLGDRLDAVDSQLARIEGNIDKVSVKEFGAKGDGVTDDTWAFRNAINYASTNNLIVFVPVGVFLVSSLNLPSYIVIQGVSGISQHPKDFKNASVIAQIPSTNNHLIIGEDGCEYVQLRDLHFVGNKNQQSELNDCIHLNQGEGQEAQWRLERVVIRDFKGNGIHTSFNRRAIRVIDCNIYNCNNGIELNGTDNLVTDTLIHNNDKNGISVNSYVNKIISCEIFRNEQNGIALFSSAHHVTIIGNGINNNSRCGIYTDDNSSDISIVSNSIRTNSLLSDGGYSDIEVKGDNISIISNTFEYESNVSQNKVSHKIKAIKNFNCFANSFDDGYTTSEINNITRAIGNTRSFQSNYTPTSGTYKKGDFIFQSTPKKGDNHGWICVDDVNLTWEKVGIIGASKMSTLTPSDSVDVNSIRSDLNTLISKLKTFGLMS